LRLAFFGRVTAEKGVHLLREAMRQLPPGLAVSLDLYGDGPEFASLQQAVAADPALAGIRLCGTLTYGPELFGRIRGYDYVVVPNLGDEQPRIVYDAFSQGVPVLASDTTGLRQCVSDGRTGRFFETGDAASLARLLADAASPQRRSDRPRMAAECVRVAQSMTHAAMHQRRARLIADFLES
jgi:glycosyltransferase involved in cell wall biosynthesis